MDKLRDKDGRLLPGHPGLKQKGSTGTISREIREKILDFIAGEIDNLPSLYNSLKATDKIKMLNVLMQISLPKFQSVQEPQNIKIVWTDPEPDKEIRLHQVN